MRLEIRIGGQEPRPTSISVSRSLRAAISSAAVTLPLAEDLMPGQEAEIHVDGAAILTGWLVSATDDYAAKTTEARILSRTCLLAHRSLGTAARWRNVSVGEIVRQVCLWAGASVESRAPDGPRISLDAEPDRSCWDTIADALRGQPIAATDTGDGRLLLLSLDGGGTVHRVETRGWATAWSRTRDITNRRSSYSLHRVTLADQAVSPALRDAWTSDLGWDATIRAPRRISAPETQDLLRWEALRRAGESITFSLSWPSWDISGNLPMPGDWLEVDGDRLLLLDLAISAGPGGRTATATLGYPEALGLRPKPVRGAATKRPRMLEVGW